MKCLLCGKNVDNEFAAGYSALMTKSAVSAVGKLLMMVGALVAVPAVAATMMGFGAVGIVGGSLASLWQSWIGSVAAGSTFATLQSLGASGLFTSAAIAGGATATAGAATTSITAQQGSSLSFKCPRCRATIRVSASLD